MTYNKIVSEPTRPEENFNVFSMDAGLRVELETMLPSSLEKEEQQMTSQSFCCFEVRKVNTSVQFHFSYFTMLTCFHAGNIKLRRNYAFKI